MRYSTLFILSSLLVCITAEAKAEWNTTRQGLDLYNCRYEGPLETDEQLRDLSNRERNVYVSPAQLYSEFNRWRNADALTLTFAGTRRVGQDQRSPIAGDYSPRQREDALMREPLGVPERVCGCVNLIQNQWIYYFGDSPESESVVNNEAIQLVGRRAEIAQQNRCLDPMQIQSENTPCDPRFADVPNVNTGLTENEFGLQRNAGEEKLKTTLAGTFNHVRLVNRSAITDNFAEHVRREQDRIEDQEAMIDMAVSLTVGLVSDHAASALTEYMSPVVSGILGPSGNPTRSFVENLINDSLGDLNQGVIDDLTNLDEDMDLGDFLSFQRSLNNNLEETNALDHVNLMVGGPGGANSAINTKLRHAANVYTQEKRLVYLTNRYFRERPGRHVLDGVEVGSTDIGPRTACEMQKHGIPMTSEYLGSQVKARKLKEMFDVMETILAPDAPDSSIEYRARERTLVSLYNRWPCTFGVLNASSCSNRRRR